MEARERLAPPRAIPASESALRSHPCVAVSSAQVVPAYQLHANSILHVLRPGIRSRCFIAWCLDRRIELVHIRPGKPVENAYVESFHGRLREECLQVSWFRNLFDARRQIETWRGHYNTDRPHSSLGYRTPLEFAALNRAAVNLVLGWGKGSQTPTGEQIEVSCRMLE